jgi:8-oxo-dGTP pyrophosphatase MutT (NUDIX family)
MIHPGRKRVYAHLRIGKVLNGRWATAGGKFEKTERGVRQKAAQAAADELLQEAGIDVHGNLERLLFHSAEVEVSDKGLFNCHVFFLHLMDGEVPRNREPDKHADWVLDTVEGHLERNPLPGMRMGLEHLLAYPEEMFAPSK